MLWSLYTSGILFHMGWTLGRNHRLRYPWWKLYIGGFIWALFWPWHLFSDLFLSKGKGGDLNDELES